MGDPWNYEPDIYRPGTITIILIWIAVFGGAMVYLFNGTWPETPEEFYSSCIKSQGSFKCDTCADATVQSCDLLYKKNYIQRKEGIFYYCVLDKLKGCENDHLAKAYIEICKDEYKIELARLEKR